MDGWIKIHRRIRRWAHYREPSVLLVFLDLLLAASQRPAVQRGVRLKAGELVTSVRTLQAATGLSFHPIVKALRVLEDSGEIKRRYYKNITIVSIANFRQYQVKEADKGADSVADTVAESATLPSDTVAENATPSQECCEKCNTTVAENATAKNSSVAESAAPTPCNINKNIYNTTTTTPAGAGAVADARAHEEEFWQEALSRLKVEQGCMSFGLDPESYRKLVNEVRADWAFKGETDLRLGHLHNTLRIKVAEMRRAMQSKNTKTESNGNARRQDSTGDDERARFIESLERRAHTYRSKVR